MTSSCVEVHNKMEDDTALAAAQRPGLQLPCAAGAAQGRLHAVFGATAQRVRLLFRVIAHAGMRWEGRTA